MRSTEFDIERSKQLEKIQMQFQNEDAFQINCKGNIKFDDLCNASPETLYNIIQGSNDPESILVSLL